MSKADDYEVYKVQIKAQDFCALSQDALTRIMLARQIANDLLVLQRTTIAFEHGINSTDIAERQAQIAMWHHGLLLLAGKVYEGWLEIEKIAKSESIGQFHRGSCGRRQALKSFLRLRKNFKPVPLPDGTKKSLLGVVRNKTGFHYGNQTQYRREIDSLKKRTKKGDVIEFIASSDVANSVYLFAEESRIFGLLDLLFPSMERQKQHLSFHQLVVRSVGDMTCFLADAITLLLEPLYNDEAVEIKLTPIDMEGREHIETISLPFLIRTQPRAN